MPIIKHEENEGIEERKAWFPYGLFKKSRISLLNSKIKQKKIRQDTMEDIVEAKFRMYNGFINRKEVQDHVDKFPFATKAFDYDYWLKMCYHDFEEEEKKC